MALWQKLYYAGMVLTLLMTVTGELIWLPDPLRLGYGIYWIDVIDELIYVLVLIPLLWISGAIFHMFMHANVWMRIRTAAVLLAGLTSAVILLTIPKQLEYSAGATSSAT